MYYNDKFEKEFNEKDNKLSEIEAINILNRQVNLLKKRIPIFEKANINDFLNFTYMENIIWFEKEYFWIFDIKSNIYITEFRK